METHQREDPCMVVYICGRAMDGRWDLQGVARSPIYRQQENKRARAEAEAQGDRIDTALQIMSSLARSLETSLGNHEDD